MMIPNHSIMFREVLPAAAGCSEPTNFEQRTVRGSRFQAGRLEARPSENWDGKK